MKMTRILIFYVISQISSFYYFIRIFISCNKVLISLYLIVVRENNINFYNCKQLTSSLKKLMILNSIMYLM